MQNKNQLGYPEIHSSRVVFSQSNVYSGVPVEMIDYISYHCVFWLLFASLVQIFQVILVYY